MVTNLLVAANTIVTYVILGVILVLFVVWVLFSGKKNKQRQKEYEEQLEAISEGHKVKTAGGICGIVVEVCDDKTVIIETGSEKSGKSYIKLDKELIAQSDAKGPTQIAREAAEAQRKAAKEGGKTATGETEISDFDFSASTHAEEKKSEDEHHESDGGSL